MYDFHTHTFLSDGVLAPTELIQRAVNKGYKVIAVTDHVGPGNLELVLNTLTKDCDLASKRWDILAIPGVEITYAPPDDIDSMAFDARRLGAKIVNVHGETIVEPVEEGTNHAAVNSKNVDVLAHPGLITVGDAQLAVQNNVFLEISGRKGHGFANGHVWKTAQNVGAQVVLDSDAHEPEDLLERDFAIRVAQGAGLDSEQADDLLDMQPLNLLRKLGLLS